MALLTAIVAVPIANIDMSDGPYRVKTSAPDQVHTNIGRFTNPIPNNNSRQLLIPSQRVRLSAPRMARFNSELFKNTKPFVPPDWSSVFRTPDFLPRRSPQNALVLTSSVTTTTPFSKVDWSNAFRLPDFLPPPQPYNILIYSGVPFSQDDWSARVQTVDSSPPPAQPYNLNLYSPTIAAPFSQTDWPRVSPVGSREGFSDQAIWSFEIPFSQTDWPKANTVRRIAPDQAAYNQNIYTVTVTAAPFSQTNWAAPFGNRYFPSAQVAGGIIDITLPFAQFDWSKPFSVISSPPQARPYNLNIAIPTVTAKPFAQTDWPRVRPIIPSEGFSDQAIWLFEIPFHQTDWSKTRFAVFLPPAQPPNINLLSNPQPFAQYDWLHPFVPPLGRPVTQQPNYPNFYKNPQPFAQLDWIKPIRVPTVPGAPLPLNVNLYTGAPPAPFAQFDWSKPVRLPAVPQRQQDAININLFTNPLPFSPDDWPVTRRAPSARGALPHFNISLYAVPFTPIDWSVRRNLVSARQLDIPNIALRSGVQPVQPPFVPIDWSISRRLRIEQPSIPAYNINVYFNVPFSPNYIARGGRRCIVAVDAGRFMVSTALRRERVVVGISNNVSQTNNLLPPIDETVEFETVTFDFGLILQPGVIITAVLALTCDVFEGTDPTPTARLIGPSVLAPSPNSGLANQAVGQMVGSMIGEVTYRLQCVAQCSDGQKLSLWAHLACQTPD
jgi:hypothetical protein